MNTCSRAQVEVNSTQTYTYFHIIPNVEPLFSWTVRWKLHGFIVLLKRIVRRVYREVLNSTVKQGDALCCNSTITYHYHSNSNSAATALYKIDSNSPIRRRICCQSVSSSLKIIVSEFSADITLQSSELLSTSHLANNACLSIKEGDFGVEKLC